MTKRPEPEPRITSADLVAQWRDLCAGVRETGTEQLQKLTPRTLGLVGLGLLLAGGVSWLLRRGEKRESAAPPAGPPLQVTVGGVPTSLEDLGKAVVAGVVQGLTDTGLGPQAPAVNQTGEVPDAGDA